MSTTYAIARKLAEISIKHKELVAYHSIINPTNCVDVAMNLGKVLELQTEILFVLNELNRKPS